jgi:hypothetical protein
MTSGSHCFLCTLLLISLPGSGKLRRRQPKTAPQRHPSQFQPPHAAGIQRVAFVIATDFLDLAGEEQVINKRRSAMGTVYGLYVGFTRM